jgi:hypothetical protein
MRCNHIDCIALARRYPVLILRPYPACTPAEAIIELPLCIEHSETTKPADLISDPAWQQIVEGFAKQGKARPKRRLTELRWISAEEAASYGFGVKQ